MAKEKWKAIKGFENSYQISSLGRVKSLPRVITFKTGTKIFLKGKFLSPSFPKGKYPHVVLHKGDKPFYKTVHRLVATAFVPNPKNYPFVLHKDNNKHNFKWSNLKWGTALHNMRDARKDKIIPSLKGEQHPQAKLKRLQVLQIRSLHKTSKYTYVQLAKKFKVDRTLVGLIVRKQLWTHLN